MYKEHYACFACKAGFSKPAVLVDNGNLTYEQHVARLGAMKNCPTCGERGVAVPNSFRCPKRHDDAGWVLAERLVASGAKGFPEFARARPGTLARLWRGLGCMQHAPEATWARMWYPHHAREVDQWVRFMLATPYAPRAPPTYTKAQAAERKQRARPLHGDPKYGYRTRS